MSPGRVFLPRPRMAEQKEEPKFFPRFGLGTWITVLILGILFPMMILVGIATRQAVDASRALAQTHLAELSRALASSIDNHLKSQLSALDTLSLAPEFNGPRSEGALDGYARQIAIRMGVAVAIFRPDGTQIVNTLLPQGAPLPKTALAAMVNEAVRTKKPVVSDLARSSVTGRLGFGVGLPVERNGQVIAVLAALSNTAILHDILARQDLPEGIFASLVDRTATIVARSDARHSDFAGRRIVEENAQKLAAKSSGQFSGYALEGAWREFAFTKLSIADGWSLVVGQTLEDMNRESERYASRLALIGIFVLTISCVLALLVTRIIVRPIAALDRYAATLGVVDDTNRPALDRSYVTQVARLQANILEAESRLRADENRFREFLNLLDLAIFMARSLEGRIFYWSRGAAEFYGFSHDEAVGKNSHALLRTAFPVPISEIEDSLQTTGHWTGGLVHMTKDGRIVDAASQMSMTTLEDGDTHVLEILHDVTDLHHTQRDLQLALETGDIGTFFIDLVSGDVVVDERSRKLLGGHHDTITRSEFIALIPRDERAAFDTAMARCIGVRGDGILDAEITIFRPGNSVAVISIRGQAERSAGTPVSIAGVMMDVTRLREADLQRSQSSSVRSTG